MSPSPYQIGTFGVQCPFCNLVIPCAVTVSPLMEHKPGSISLSSDVDVRIYEAHLRAHEAVETDE